MQMGHPPTFQIAQSLVWFRYIDSDSPQTDVIHCTGEEMRGIMVVIIIIDDHHHSPITAEYFLFLNASWEIDMKNY